MNLDYSPADDAFRADIRAWLEANLPRELSDKVLNHKRLNREDFAGIDWEADPNYEFRTALEKEPDWLRRRYRKACDRARQVTAAADSLDDVSVSTRIGGKPFTLRWVMLHMIEETARHAGHADLLREAIDGVVGE